MTMEYVPYKYIGMLCTVERCIVFTWLNIVFLDIAEIVYTGQTLVPPGVNSQKSVITEIVAYI